MQTLSFAVQYKCLGILACSYSFRDIQIIFITTTVFPGIQLNCAACFLRSHWRRSAIQLVKIEKYDLGPNGTFSKTLESHTSAETSKTCLSPYVLKEALQPWNTSGQNLRWVCLGRPHLQAANSFGKICAKEEKKNRCVGWGMEPSLAFENTLSCIGTNSFSTFWFWGIRFSNYYRKLYSIKFRGEFMNFGEWLVLFVFGQREYFGYSCSFSLGVVWELIAVMCSEQLYAGSGLPQGPFLENNCTSSGFTMGFCQWSEMGPKVGFGVQKWVKSGSKPTFHPLQTHFGIFAKTPLFSQFKGGGSCFLKRALKQSRPSIRAALVFEQDVLSWNIVCNNCVSNGTPHFLQKIQNPISAKTSSLGAIRLFDEDPYKIWYNIAVLPGKSYTPQNPLSWEHLQLGKKMLAWDNATNRQMLPWGCGGLGWTSSLRQKYRTCRPQTSCTEEHLHLGHSSSCTRQISKQTSAFLARLAVHRKETS